jgi:membrane-bound serine protease (ClpP class)
LLIEFYQPGVVAPGTIGAICLILALYAFDALSVNYSGLALIVLGIGLMIAEAFAPSFGILGIGGITAFVLGSVILVNPDMTGYDLNPWLIAAFAVISVLLCVVSTGLLLKVRRMPVVSGREELLGGLATAMEDFDQLGRVWIRSEAWTARTSSPVKNGQKLKVESMEGLTLNVTPLNTETGE